MVHHLKIIFLHSINLILLLFIKVFLSSILRRPFYLGIKIKNNILLTRTRTYQNSVSALRRSLQKDRRTHSERFYGEFGTLKRLILVLIVFDENALSSFSSPGLVCVFVNLL